MPTIIGIAGRKGSGKSTAAGVLVRTFGFREMPFAEPLKQMIRCYLSYREVDIERIDDMLEGSAKEIPCPELMGQSPRHAMQTLGTEWGRKLINDRFWLDAVKQRIDVRASRCEGIVIPDVRFDDEAEAIRAWGGQIWRIERGMPENTDSHASEQGVSDRLVDLTIANIAPNAAAFREVMHNVVYESLFR